MSSSAAPAATNGLAPAKGGPDLESQMLQFLEPDKFDALKRVIVQIKKGDIAPINVKSEIKAALGDNADQFMSIIENRAINRLPSVKTWGGQKEPTGQAMQSTGQAVVAAAAAAAATAEVARDIKPPQTQQESSAQLQMNARDADSVVKALEHMMMTGVPETDPDLIHAANIVQTFVKNLSNHIIKGYETKPKPAGNSVFNDHQLELLKSQVNAYQLLIMGRNLDDSSLKYLKLGAGRPSAQLVVMCLQRLFKHRRAVFQVSPNHIVPQQVSPTLGQRLLCMVAHAPTMCPKMSDNPSVIDEEWKHQTSALIATRQEAFDAARESGGQIPIEMRMRDAAQKLSALQDTVRSKVLSAHDDDRTTKQIRKFVDREKKEKHKLHSQYLNDVKDHFATFKRYHSDCHRLRKRLGNQAVQWHNSQEKKDIAQEQQAERERVKALRDHDEEAYLALVKNSKNERIISLIKQTDSFMRELGMKVEDSRRQAARDRGEAEDLDGDKGNMEEGEIDGDLDIASVKKTQDTYNALTHKVTEVVERQPRMMDHAGTMREYQLKGLQWMASLYNNGLNGILADEMGLGKTIQTVSLLAYLWEQKNIRGPFLCIVPLTTLHNNWKAELRKWVPQLQVTVYEGKPDERKRLREGPIEGGTFNVLLTTFEYAMLDKRHLKKIVWEYIIVDEAHRLKNPKCKLSRDLNKYYNSKRRIALTGTPLQNDLQEVWALLNFLSPSIFNSIDTFDQWFNKPFAGSATEKMEMTEEEKLLIVERLHKVLRPFILRREKSQVETQLPEKLELVIKVRMTEMQKAMYVRIEKTGKLNGRSLQNNVMQLRKVCNHPFLQEDSYNLNDDLWRCSGKVELMDRLLRKLKKGGHRVLMFSQMTAMISIMIDYFNFRGYKHMRLDGNTDSHTRMRLLNDFNAANSEYFVFILSTKAGGLGLNLQSADTVIIFDSDWNPQADLQAMARAHRIGQKKQVLVLRLVTEESVEEQMLTTAYQKLDHEAMVIQAGMFNDRHDDTLRREKMEALMHAEGDERDDDEIDAGDEGHAELSELNSRIARGAEEYELFQQWDREHAQEAGYNGVNDLNEWLNSRIVGKDELPDYLCGEVEIEPDPEDPDVLMDAGGRGQRKRTEIRYNDERSEAQWLKDSDLIIDETAGSQGCKKRMKL